MSSYQAISYKRMGLQLVSAALFYGVGRYTKVENIGKATLPVALSAIAQGMQPKARNEIGKTTRTNTWLHLLSFGLITYGMHRALLTKRAKVLAGGALFGSQIFISLYKARTLKVPNELDCAVHVLDCISFDTIENKRLLSEKKIVAVKKYIIECRKNNVSSNFYSPILQSIFSSELGINGIDPKKKAITIKDFVEFFSQNGIQSSNIFVMLDLTINDASEKDKAIITQWLNDKGNAIKTAWEQQTQNKQ